MKRAILTWTLTAGLAGLFLLAGLGKFGEEATRNFAAFGYGDGFRVFIGVAELAGALGLLAPALASWAAGGLVLIMVGAVYTHVANDISPIFPAVTGGLLVVVAVLRHPRALFLASPESAGSQTEGRGEGRGASKSPGASRPAA